MSIRPRFVVVLLASALVSNLLAAQEPDATAAARPSLVFSTYLGGSGRAQTRPIAVAVDAAGYIYVTGRTEARDFPSVNAAQPRYGGGGNDAFVIKLTPDGQRIVYATFLGGGDREWGEKIATDSTGHAYIAGTTYSRNFPTTSGAAQKKFGGGDRDGFVAKLAPDGTLMYVTLLGGNGTDRDGDCRRHRRRRVRRGQHQFQTAGERCCGDRRNGRRRWVGRAGGASRRAWLRR